MSIGIEHSERAETNLTTGKARQTTEQSVHVEVQQEDGAFLGAELNTDEFCTAGSVGQERGPNKVVVTKSGGTEHGKVEIEVSGKAGISLNEFTESSLQKNGRHTHVEVKQGVGC